MMTVKFLTAGAVQARTIPFRAKDDKLIPIYA